MYIQRIKTKQGHPVPKTSHSPKGPFPPELYEQSELVTEYTPQPDGGDDDIPLGSTAQNDFKPIRWFKCKSCKDLVPEPQLGTHNCQEVHGED